MLYVVLQTGYALHGEGRASICVQRLCFRCLLSHCEEWTAPQTAVDDGVSRDILRRNDIALVPDIVAKPAKVLRKPRIPYGERPHCDALLRGAKVDLHTNNIYISVLIENTHLYDPPFDMP